MYSNNQLIAKATTATKRMTNNPITESQAKQIIAKVLEYQDYYISKANTNDMLDLIEYAIKEQTTK